MPAPTDIKYRAFISYSHVDARWAKWIQSGIEGFRVDKDLVGRITATGSVPTSLRPVFRDRDEFTAGHTVDEETRKAIEGSAALIVLCSPAALKSHFVDLELRLFRSRYPERPVIPVIVGGNPGDPQAECFPPALRYKIEADGSIGAEPEDVLAADLREHADGRQLALAKVLARLLGLSTDDVFRRAERARKRSERIRNGIAGSLAILLVAIAASAWIAWDKSKVAQREEGLKLVSGTYELLYRDPSAAFLKARRASALLTNRKDSQAALDDAYKVAVLHHLNRRETALMSGSGPSYLAGRWKQGDVFTKPSPDGRHLLVVTERGANGPNPPGEVYLLNNESLRTTRLAPCFDSNRRVEDVGFDHESRNVFVTRQFELSIYSLVGQCIGKFDLSCCTKSPVHLVEGYLADRFVLAAESKGGLWLIDPKERRTFATLQREFKGDAVTAATLSPDRRRAAVVFESGRAALVAFGPDVTPRMRDFIKERTLFAGFVPGRNDRLVTTSDDGWIRQWDVVDDDVREIAGQRIPDVAIDWIAFSDDGREMLAVGDNRAVYVIDQQTHRLVAEVEARQNVDWATARSVPMQSVEMQVEAASVSASIDLPPTAVDVVRSFQVGGRAWLVVARPGADNRPSYSTYLVDGDRAVTFPGLEVNAEAIEQYGDLFWIRSHPFDWEPPAGPVLRLDGSDAVFYRKRGVRAVAAHEDKHFLAADQGLFAVEGKRLTRVLRETVSLQGLLARGDQLWIATNQGAYVLEKERLVRVTEPFVDVRKIKEAGSHVWLLTKKPGNMFGASGPAYRVDDYLAHAYPGGKAQVTDVVELGGRTWLLGAPGLHVFDGGRAIEIGPIPQDVIGLREDHGRVIADTQSGSIFRNPGPTYEIDPATLRAGSAGSAASK